MKYCMYSLLQIITFVNWKVQDQLTSFDLVLALLPLFLTQDVFLPFLMFTGNARLPASLSVPGGVSSASFPVPLLLSLSLNLHLFSSLFFFCPPPVLLLPSSLFPSFCSFFPRFQHTPYKCQLPLQKWLLFILLSPEDTLS